MSRRILGSLLVVGALVAPLVTSAAPNTASEMTIIFVDIDKVIADVDEGKIAQAALTKEQTARQARISGIEAKLKKLQDKVQGMAGKGNTPALQAAAADYQQLAQEYQQIIQQSQKDMVPFQGSDSREFWQRAEQRNADTASLYADLGLTHYAAMEAFVRWHY